MSEDKVDRFNSDGVLKLLLHDTFKKIRVANKVPKLGSLGEPRPSITFLAF